MSLSPRDESPRDFLKVFEVIVMGEEDEVTSPMKSQNQSAERFKELKLEDESSAMTLSQFARNSNNG